MHWLQSFEKPFQALIQTVRPVPLKHYVIDNHNARRLSHRLQDEEHTMIDTSRFQVLDWTFPHYERVKQCWKKCHQYHYQLSYELNQLCQQIETDPLLGCPAILFCLSKKKCLEYANAIEQSFVNREESEQISALYRKYLRDYDTFSQIRELEPLLRKGIAIHHSGLLPTLREVIELLMKQKLIKIIFATETFAVGLNFPVKTVVLSNVRKPSQHGFRDLTVSEFKQMTGRAGRRFIDTVGNVVFWFYPLSHYPEYMTIDNYIKGVASNISSKCQFDPCFILRTIKDYSIYKDHSLKYYQDSSTELPLSLRPFYQYLQEKRQMDSMGLKYVNKSLEKRWKQLSSEEMHQVQSWRESEKQIADRFLQQIVQFLVQHEFLQEGTLDYLPKGILCLRFHEINSILFINHVEEIFREDGQRLLPILSMFIEEGKVIEEISFSEEPIVYYQTLHDTTYSLFFETCSKWKWFPYNYRIVSHWIHHPTLTYDELQASFPYYDLGLIIKVLVKMNQIATELMEQLVFLNKSHLISSLVEQKECLLRSPFKIESLYCNL